MSRYRHVRCSHWMPEGWCPVDGCSHWDGRSHEDIITSDPWRAERERFAARVRRAERRAETEGECLPDPDWI